MNRAIEPIWYAFGGKPYHGSFPAFFSAKEFPSLALIPEQFILIKNELGNILRKNNKILQPYFNRSLVSKDGHWDVVEFYFWGQQNKLNCDLCPNISSFLDNIPGLLTAGFSRLAPGTKIHPHIGDTNTIARCHLGVIIPAGLPGCGIEVNKVSKEWKEGEWLIFCDAYEHSAWNLSSADRYILLLDVLLPEFEMQKAEIVKDVRSYLALQEEFEKHPWKKKLPRFILRRMRRSIRKKI